MPMNQRDVLRFQARCIRSYRRHLHRQTKQPISGNQAVKSWIDTGLSKQFRLHFPGK